MNHDLMVGSRIYVLKHRSTKNSLFSHPFCAYLMHPKKLFFILEYFKWYRINGRDPDNRCPTADI